VSSLVLIFFALPFLFLCDPYSLARLFRQSPRHADVFGLKWGGYVLPPLSFFSDFRRGTLIDSSSILPFPFTAAILPVPPLFRSSKGTLVEHPSYFFSRKPFSSSSPSFCLPTPNECRSLAKIYFAASVRLGAPCL